MFLYHGSNQEITLIDLRICKPYKDFGRGFYLTMLEQQAELMAKRTARIFGGTQYVTIYKFDETVLKNEALSIKTFSEPNIDWALFVLNNRNRDFNDHSELNSNQDNKYDIVVGPVANDDIALLFRYFINEHIDVTALVNGMKYRKLNDQYSFHTDRAVELLTKVK